MSPIVRKRLTRIHTWTGLIAGLVIVVLAVVEQGSPHQNAKSLLYLDAYSGDVLSLKHYATDITLGRKIYLYIIALHAGLVGGLGYQLLLVAALGIPVQAYSGIVPWFRRKGRRYRTLADPRADREDPRRGHRDQVVHAQYLILLGPDRPRSA